MNKSKNKDLAEKIMDWLEKRGLFTESLFLYFNHSRAASNRPSSAFKDQTKECRTKNGTAYYLTDGLDSPCEYADPDHVSMTFEGDFYCVLNDSRFMDTAEQFVAFLGELGYYYEMGHAWSLTIWPN